MKEAPSGNGKGGRPEAFDPARQGARRLGDFLFPRRFFRRHVGGLPPVPAYFFHRPEPVEFARICRAVRSSGLRPVTFSEILDGRADAERSVAISFDDGWSSVWSVAFPLARRFDVRFTVFLNAASMRERTRRPPGPEVGRAAGATLDGETVPARMLTWDQVREMQESGLVDVQSHSAHHGVVFTSDRVSGLAGLRGPFPLDGVAPLVVRDGGRDVVRSRLQPGTPLHPWAPALAAGRRYMEDERFRAAVVDHFADRPERLDDPGAVREAAGLRRPGWEGRWETSVERRRRVMNDLDHGRRELGTRLEGAPARVLAPPWAAFHRTVPALARETGHELVVLGYPFVAPRKSPLPLYPRLFGDAIWLLLEGPGRGFLRWRRSRAAARRRRRLGDVP